MSGEPGIVDQGQVFSNHQGKGRDQYGSWGITLFTHMGGAGPPFRNVLKVNVCKVYTYEYFLGFF